MIIAQTIYQQLGAGRFCAMTGASTFTAHPKALSFRLPSTRHFVRDKINVVCITLNDLDLYDFDFGRIQGMAYSHIKKLENIHAEDLQQTFRSVTGLDTHL